MGQFRSSRFSDVRKEIHHQVLVLLVQVAYAHVYHVIILDAIMLGQLFVIEFQNSLSVGKDLSFSVDSRLNGYEAFQLLDSCLGVDFYVVELIVL